MRCQLRTDIKTLLFFNALRPRLCSLFGTVGSIRVWRSIEKDNRPTYENINKITGDYGEIRILEFSKDGAMKSFRSS